MASTIGIEIANGEFYPIFEEYSTVKKRLILTTAHDKQPSVHIDLYKSDSRTLNGAIFMGTLAVDNIKPKLKGVPSIELTISSNRNGEISAYAVDLDDPSKEYHHLQIYLKSLPVGNVKKTEVKIEKPIREDEKHRLMVNFSLNTNEEKPEKKHLSIVPVIIAGLCLLLVLSGLWFFLFSEISPFTFNRRENIANPPTSSLVLADSLSQTQNSSPTNQTETSSTNSQNNGTSVLESYNSENSTNLSISQGQEMPKLIEGMVESTNSSSGITGTELNLSSNPVFIEPPVNTPVILAPVVPPVEEMLDRERPPAPVTSYRVPTVIPYEGVSYTIRWGDTLWEISEAFYRNPWLYPRIARFNNIRNPDIIISGRTIRIPPR